MSCEQAQEACRRYYPIFVDLRGKKVLIVGGGNVARRKIESLLAHGATVELIAKEMSPQVAAWVEKGLIEHAGQDFSESRLESFFMVIAATNDASLNRRVSRKAQEHGLLINVVDQPSDCNFIVPSVLRRGDLVVAVSTSGKSPAFARKIREDLEQHFGDEIESFLTLMGYLREKVLAHGLAQDHNKKVFEKLIASPLLLAIRDNDWDLAASVISEILAQPFSREEVMTYTRKSE
jgi:precorrin-2 dehydrogenase/sirohydrochlorin ferrochelatase